VHLAGRSRATSTGPFAIRPRIAYSEIIDSLIFRLFRRLPLKFSTHPKVNYLLAYERVNVNGIAANNSSKTPLSLALWKVAEFDAPLDYLRSMLIRKDEICAR
jgi:hypothetical protein